MSGGWIQFLISRESSSLLSPFFFSPNAWTRFSVTVSIMPRDHATHTHAHTPTRLPTHTSPLPFDFLFKGFIISILFFISFSLTFFRFFFTTPGGTECGLVAVSTSATPRTVVIEGESMTSDQVLRVVDALVKWLAANNYKVCENVLYSPLVYGCVTCDAWGGWLVPLFVCGVCVRVRVRCGAGAVRCDARVDAAVASGPCSTDSHCRLGVVVLQIVASGLECLQYAISCDPVSA